MCAIGARARPRMNTGGRTSKPNLNRLFRLQKHACKILLDYNVENELESMQELKILTIYERLFLRKSKFMFKVYKSETPPFIYEMFNLKTINENLSVLRSSISLSCTTPCVCVCVVCSLVIM